MIPRRSWLRLHRSVLGQRHGEDLEVLLVWDQDVPDLVLPRHRSALPSVLDATSVARGFGTRLLLNAPIAQVMGNYLSWCPRASRMSARTSMWRSSCMNGFPQAACAARCRSCWSRASGGIHVPEIVVASAKGCSSWVSPVAQEGGQDPRLGRVFRDVVLAEDHAAALALFELHA